MKKPIIEAVAIAEREEIKCPFCSNTLEIWEAKRGKGFVGQCYICGARFFGRSLASFNALTLKNWAKRNYKGKARDGSRYYYDAKFGLRAFEYL